MASLKLNPTLFDKLTSSANVLGVTDETELPELEISRASMRFYTVPNIERFNETALRATVRREIAWLLNTTNLGSAIDLDPYPQVKTSVLNYGVPDLTGKASSRGAIRGRALEIRAAIEAFEPRLDPKQLSVDPRDIIERENAITYVIDGNIYSAVEAMPVQLLTDVEADTGAVTIRD